MDPMTILGLVSLLGVAFKGMYDFTRGIQEDEYQSKLQEQGKDPASLAEKQLQLNEDVSKKNFNLQAQQFEYQKELNQLTMQREDNAFQRQVADLKNAGLSPLMIAGGSPASVLTSAQAPQRDITGINNAISNMIGAYNDAFSRKLQSRQFALQNKVQTAQAYTQLAELSMQRKKVNLENAILGLDYKYYKNHPERNLGLQSVIINALERMISRNPSANIPGFPKIDLPASLGSNPGNGGLLFDLITDPEKVKEQYNIPTPRFISGKPKEVTQKDIDKDLSKIEKAQKSRVDQAIQFIDIKKDYDSKLKTIWDYTNAKKYYKDFDEFKVVLSSKKHKASYLNAMNIQYVPHKRLNLGS